MKLLPAFAVRGLLRLLVRRIEVGPDYLFDRSIKVDLGGGRIRYLRRADLPIGGVARPYLLRWWLIPRNDWFNVYLHQTLRDDDDRALHDHPYINLSLILDGGYVEVLPDGRGRLIRKWRGPGSLLMRRSRTRHRLELPPPEFEPGPVALDPPCSWSLFVTGPRTRAWGFHCRGGWIHFRDFTDPADGGATVGRGCDAPTSIPGTDEREFVSREAVP